MRWLVELYVLVIRWYGRCNIGGVVPCRVFNYIYSLTYSYNNITNMISELGA